MSRLPLLTVFALVCVITAACGNSSTPSSPPTPAPSQLKPPLRGLLDRSGVPPSAFVGTLAGFVVNAYWADLQPTDTDTLAPNNVIDQAITSVRGINATHHTDLGLKIRLFAGIWAPDWAKNLGGAPVQVAGPQSGGGGTIGRFWTDAFGAAYDRLEDLLAARYDSIPEVREVTIARCMTIFDEPFQRQSGSQAVVRALLAAGYSVQADEQCQEQEIIASRVWQHTRSDLSFNPYQAITSTGSTYSDLNFTESMMSYCRAQLGQACVLENNSIRYPPSRLGTGYEEMYAAMKSLGPPIAFQTAVAQRVGQLAPTLSYAASLGANSVELPDGYPSMLSSSAASSSGQQLAVNPL